MDWEYRRMILEKDQSRADEILNFSSFGEVNSIWGTCSLNYRLKSPSLLVGLADKG